MDLSHRKKYSICTKAAASVTAFVFLFTSTAPAQLISQPVTPPFVAPFNNQIPLELGSVVETHSASEKSPFVYLIQDAHDSQDAQKNISLILKQLSEKENVSLVCFEGGSREFDRSFYFFSEDSEENKEVWNTLFDEGEIGGVERFALESPRQVRLFGIEDSKTYFKNIHSIQKIYSQSAQMDLEIRDVDSDFSSKAGRVLTGDVKKIRDLKQAMNQKRISLARYAKELSNWNPEILSPANQRQWPQLVRLMKLSEMESKIRLPKSGIPSEIKQILDSNYSKGHLRWYIEKLTDRGLDFEKNNELKDWIGFQILKDELSAPGLFEELERFETQILNRMKISREARKFLEEEHAWELTKKMMSLQLTRKEWQEARKISPSTGLARAALENYQIVEARDEILAEKTLDKIRDFKSKKTAMVFGGFHTDQIAELLKKKSISYAIISPAISNSDKKINYRARMTPPDQTSPVVVGASLGIRDAEPYVSHLEKAADQILAGKTKRRSPPERHKDRYVIDFKGTKVDLLNAAIDGSFRLEWLTSVSEEDAARYQKIRTVPLRILEKRLRRSGFIISYDSLLAHASDTKKFFGAEAVKKIFDTRTSLISEIDEKSAAGDLPGMKVIDIVDAWYLMTLLRETYKKASREGWNTIPSLAKQVGVSDAVIRYAVQSNGLIQSERLRGFTGNKARLRISPEESRRITLLFYAALKKFVAEAESIDPNLKGKIKSWSDLDEALKSWYRAEDVCVQLGFTIPAVHKAWKTGRLRSVKVHVPYAEQGGRYFYPGDIRNLQEKNRHRFNQIAEFINRHSAAESISLLNEPVSPEKMKQATDQLDRIIADWISPEALAERSKKTKSWINLQIQRGKIPAVRIDLLGYWGQRNVIPPAVAEEWLLAQEKKTEGASLGEEKRNQFNWWAVERGKLDELIEKIQQRSKREREKNNFAKFVNVSANIDEAFGLLVLGEAHRTIVINDDPVKTLILFPLLGALLAQNKTRPEFLAALYGKRLLPDWIARLRDRELKKFINKRGHEEYYAKPVFKVTTFDEIQEELRRIPVMPQIDFEQFQTRLVRQLNADLVQSNNFLFTEEDVKREVAKFFEQIRLLGDQEILRFASKSWLASDKNYEALREAWRSGNLSAVTGNLWGGEFQAAMQKMKRAPGETLLFFAVSGSPKPARWSQSKWQRFQKDHFSGQESAYVFSNALYRPSEYFMGASGQSLGSETLSKEADPKTGIIIKRKNWKAEIIALLKPWAISGVFASNEWFESLNSGSNAIHRKNPTDMENFGRIIHEWFPSRGSSLGTARKILSQYRSGEKNVHLERITFGRGGNARSNFGPFSREVFETLLPVNFDRPRGLPTREFIDQKEIPDVPAYLVNAIKGSPVAYGRTLTYPQGNGKFLYIKLLKTNEDPGILAYEYDMMNFLRAKKFDWGLKGNYPQGKLRLGRIPINAFPEEIVKNIGTGSKWFGLNRKDGYFTVMIYEVSDEGYSIFLNDHGIPPEQFEKAYEVNVSDRFVLARHGLFDTEIIELFHNEDHERGYDWMVDAAMGEDVIRWGAGRLNDVIGATLYPNIRITGPADFAELRFIDDIFTESKESNLRDGRLRRLGDTYGGKEDIIRNIFAASLLGDTLLALALIPVTYLDRRGELKYSVEDSNANTLLQKALSRLFASSFEILTGSKWKDEKSLNIDTRLIARQMAYFMVQGYEEEIKNGRIPENLFPGTKTDYRVSFDDFGNEIGPVSSFTLYRIGSWFTDVVTRSSHDLGSWNGVMPAQELIRALYISTTLMMVSLHEKEFEKAVRLSHAWTSDGASLGRKKLIGSTTLQIKLHVASQIEAIARKNWKDYEVSFEKSPTANSIIQGRPGEYWIHLHLRKKGLNPPPGNGMLFKMTSDNDQIILSVPMAEMDMDSGIGNLPVGLVPLKNLISDSAIQWITEKAAQTVRKRKNKIEKIIGEHKNKKRVLKYVLARAVTRNLRGTWDFLKAKQFGRDGLALDGGITFERVDLETAASSLGRKKSDYDLIVGSKTVNLIESIANGDFEREPLFRQESFDKFNPPVHPDLAEKIKLPDTPAAYTLEAAEKVFVKYNNRRIGSNIIRELFARRQFPIAKNQFVTKATLEGLLNSKTLTQASKILRVDIPLVRESALKNGAQQIGREWFISSDWIERELRRTSRLVPLHLFLEALTKHGFNLSSPYLIDLVSNPRKYFRSELIDRFFDGRSSLLEFSSGGKILHGSENAQMISLETAFHLARILRPLSWDTTGDLAKKVGVGPEYIRRLIVDENNKPGSGVQSILFCDLLIRDAQYRILPEESKRIVKLFNEKAKSYQKTVGDPSGKQINSWPDLLQILDDQWMTVEQLRQRWNLKTDAAVRHMIEKGSLNAVAVETPFSKERSPYIFSKDPQFKLLDDENQKRFKEIAAFVEPYAEKVKRINTLRQLEKEFKDWYSFESLGKEVGISADSVRNQFQRKKLPFIKMDLLGWKKGYRFVPPSVGREWIKSYADSKRREYVRASSLGRTREDYSVEIDGKKINLFDAMKNGSMQMSWIKRFHPERFEIAELPSWPLDYTIEEALGIAAQYKQRRYSENALRSYARAVAKANGYKSVKGIMTEDLEWYLNTRLLDETAQLLGYAQNSTSPLGSIALQNGAVRAGRQMLVPISWIEEERTKKHHLVTVSLLAEEMGVSEHTLFEYLKNPSKHFGRQVLEGLFGGRTELLEKSLTGGYRNVDGKQFAVDIVTAWQIIKFFNESIRKDDEETVESLAEKTGADYAVILQALQKKLISSRRAAAFFSHGDRPYYIPGKEAKRILKLFNRAVRTYQIQIAPYSKLELKTWKDLTDVLNGWDTSETLRDRWGFKSIQAINQLVERGGIRGVHVVSPLNSIGKWYFPPQEIERIEKREKKRFQQIARFVKKYSGREIVSREDLLSAVQDWQKVSELASKSGISRRALMLNIEKGLPRAVKIDLLSMAQFGYVVPPQEVQRWMEHYAAKQKTAVASSLGSSTLFLNTASKKALFQALPLIPGIRPKSVEIIAEAIIRRRPFTNLQDLEQKLADPHIDPKKPGSFSVTTIEAFQRGVTNGLVGFDAIDLNSANREKLTEGLSKISGIAPHLLPFLVDLILEQRPFTRENIRGKLSGSKEIRLEEGVVKTLAQNVEKGLPLFDLNAGSDSKLTSLLERLPEIPKTEISFIVQFIKSRRIFTKNNAALKFSEPYVMKIDDDALSALSAALDESQLSLVLFDMNNASGGKNLVNRLKLIGVPEQEIEKTADMIIKRRPFTRIDIEKRLSVPQNGSGSLDNAVIKTILEALDNGQVTLRKYKGGSKLEIPAIRRELAEDFFTYVGQPAISISKDHFFKTFVMVNGTDSDWGVVHERMRKFSEDVKYRDPNGRLPVILYLPALSRLSLKDFMEMWEKEGYQEGLRIRDEMQNASVLLRDILSDPKNAGFKKKLEEDWKKTRRRLEEFMRLLDIVSTAGSPQARLSELKKRESDQSSATGLSQLGKIPFADVIRWGIEYGVKFQNEVTTFDDFVAGADSPRINWHIFRQLSFNDLDGANFYCDLEFRRTAENIYRENQSSWKKLNEMQSRSKAKSPIIFLPLVLSQYSGFDIEGLKGLETIENEKGHYPLYLGMAREFRGLLHGEERYEYMWAQIIRFALVELNPDKSRYDERSAIATAVLERMDSKKISIRSVVEKWGARLLAKRKSDVVFDESLLFPHAHQTLLSILIAEGLITTNEMTYQSVSGYSLGTPDPVLKQFNLHWNTGDVAFEIDLLEDALMEYAKAIKLMEQINGFTDLQKSEYYEQIAYVRFLLVERAIADKDLSVDREEVVEALKMSLEDYQRVQSLNRRNLDATWKIIDIRERIERITGRGFSLGSPYGVSERSIRLVGKATWRIYGTDLRQADPELFERILAQEFSSKLPTVQFPEFIRTKEPALVITGPVSPEAILAQISSGKTVVVHYSDDEYKKRFDAQAARAVELGVLTQDQLKKHAHLADLSFAGLSESQFYEKLLKGERVGNLRSLNWIKQQAGLATSDPVVWMAKDSVIDSVSKKDIPGIGLPFVDQYLVDASVKDKILYDIERLALAVKLSRGFEELKSQGLVIFQNGRYSQTDRFLQSFLGNAILEQQVAKLIAIMA